MEAPTDDAPVEEAPVAATPAAPPTTAPTTTAHPSATSATQPPTHRQHQQMLYNVTTLLTQPLPATKPGTEAPPLTTATCNTSKRTPR